MKRNLIYKERSVIATVIVSILIVSLFLLNSFRTAEVIRARSVRRMEEGVNTVVAEVVSKLERDSLVLNAAAEIISSADVFNDRDVLETMKTITPLLETMDICVLTSDNRILQPEGSVIDAAGHLNFEAESTLGEHVSNRVISISEDGVYVLRHFVPIMQDGQVAAVIYGRTRLEELPEIMNIDNIYNASADVYIIDADTGDFIMDTRHDWLGNMSDYDNREIRGSTSWDDVREAIAHLKSGYEIVKIDGEWHNFYYTPAGINQWEIIVTVPESEAMDSLYAIRQVFYLTGALIVLVIIAYYLWIQKNAKKTMEEAVERAVLEEKLRKAEAAEKAKTTFLSNMSHDIRTPMNAIIGFATLAKTNIDKKERVLEYLTKILSSGNYLLSLINDVLDMSRIESGKLNIEEKPCTISEIFRDMRNIVQTQMRTKQLDFFMDTVDVVDEDIYCDKIHINQVLLNLLSNAIKFTPAGGAVFMTICQLPHAPAGYGSYEFRVKDTGIGMKPEFVQHIFEPFERERTSTVSGIQGTGLGMAITKNIVDSMGGTIQIETEEGHGSEFIIRLDFRLQSDRKQVEASPELRGLHALVVDDNFSTCDSVTKMLTQLGLRAVWTMHGREAILRTRQAAEMQDDFFVFIIDWALPDLSGLEVVRQVREIVGQDAIIIVMTAYEWSAVEEEAREAGVTAFCSKPVFVSELRDILESGMHKREASGEIPFLSEPNVPSNGKRLLLVEDNELNREIAEEILIENGYLIESAEDGTVAVEKVKNSAHGWYDLILMDVQMPIMNGYDATRTIRRLNDPVLASIPIVAMTANAFEEDRQRALDSGMNDYVAKPIHIDELLRILDNILHTGNP